MIFTHHSHFEIGLFWVYFKAAAT